MGGSTKKVSTAPKETQGLRNEVQNYLMGKTPATATTSRPDFGGGIVGRMAGQAWDKQQAAGGGVRLPGGTQWSNPVGVPAGGTQPAGSHPFDRGMAQAPTSFNPAQVDTSGIPQLPGFGGLDPAMFARGNVRDAQAGSSQSVDQLGGANSAFFQNMMKQLQPAFDQSRAEAVAAGREGSGNLTGSGFANILGSHLNRSMGEQQARLADYATRGMQMEVDRQTAMAGMATQASMANQQADMGYLSQLLNLGGLNQQGMMQNQRLAGDIAMQNAGFQQQGGMMQYQTQAELANANAQRFMNLLGGMSTAGLGPDAIVQKGGIGSVLAPIAGIAGTALAGPIGGAIGGSIAGMFGGGGGSRTATGNGAGMNYMW